MSSHDLLSSTDRAVQLVLNPPLLMQKILGRVRRTFVPIPQSATRKQIRGRVWFEFKFYRSLRPDDFRAFFTGSYELPVVEVMRKYVKEGDIVLDVGANIGYMSALAASFVGPTGEVHGFEPQTRCFARLQVLQQLNPDLKLVMNHVALGDKEEERELSFCVESGAPEATLVAGVHAKECVEMVRVRRLDRYIADRIRNPERIRLIKLDAEGYEFPVLLGLEGFFATTPHRPLIVSQVKPWILERLNYSVDQFAAYMDRWSYEAFDTLNTRRKVDLRNLPAYSVVLFRARNRTM
jgi:FkbM family methyltransferase